MPRYRLIVEYDGSAFHGYQAQARLPSVQQAIEDAIFSFSGERLRLQAAGRTDTGVHATGQVVHADLVREWPARTVANAINAHLVPQLVSILSAERMEGDWHARFSATRRHYLYRILSRPGPPALDQGRVWHVKRPMDVAAMADAACELLGHHDFTTFRDIECQARSPEKTLEVAEVTAHLDEVQLRFSARSFLHRQVRSMTGTLAEVGLGRWSREDVREALHARDRTACGPVAPACGLYLVGVDYD